MAGQGGILAFNTYLLRSVAWQGGQIKRASPFALQPHLLADLLQSEHLGTIPSSEKPSLNEDPPTYFPRPKPTPRISTASAKSICGVILNGITEAISSSISGKH